MRRFALPAVLLALSGAFVFWWFSPVQVLKRRTNSFLQALTIESGSGKTGRHLATYKLNALLAEEVELTAPSMPEADGNFQRSELESAFSWLCDQAKQTRFDLENFRSVRVDDGQADVTFALNALVDLPGYRPADGRYEVTFHWQQEKDGWRLTRAQWDEARK